ncbi:acyltransferase family protein [Rariglobus hedericola]|nr:acyltransferase [Rariglobus hedericola]
MRFLAAFLVVLCHARPEHWVAWSELNKDHEIISKLFFLLIRPGPEAVVIFFVLSGYFVGGKVMERFANGTFKPEDYLRDRISRIFTPLLPSLLLTIICVWIVNRGFTDGFGLELLGNIFQMQGILCERLEGNAPLWSLSYEVWFYTFAGALATLCLRPHKKNVTWLISGALILFSAWCLTMLDTVYFFCWIMGALAYVLPMPDFGKKGLIAGLVLAFIAASTSQATGTYQGGLIANSEPIHKAATLLLAASVSFLIPILANTGWRFSSSRIMLSGPYLAAFSYTLYLTHYPLLLVMNTLHAPFQAFTPVSVCLFFIKIGVCVAVAWLVYLPFERNTARVRGFIHKHQSLPPASL